MEPILLLQNHEYLKNKGLHEIEYYQPDNNDRIKTKIGNKYYTTINKRTQTSKLVQKADYMLKDSIIFIGNPDYGCGADYTKLIDLLTELSNDFYSEFSYVILLLPIDPSLTPDMIGNIPKCVKAIYITNINYDHDIIKYIPYGIYSQNKKNIHLMKNDLTKDRNILCYCNFSLNTHEDRKIVYLSIINKDFILKEHMGEYASYTISSETFIDRLNNSKFVISPRGAGIDTHRLCEILYCGAIPIVVREHFHSYYDDLPILFLDNINQFATLTEDYLEEMYLNLSLKKKDYYKQLDFNYLLSEFNRKLIGYNK